MLAAKFSCETDVEESKFLIAFWGIVASMLSTGVAGAFVLTDVFSKLKHSSRREETAEPSSDDAN